MNTHYGFLATFLLICTSISHGYPTVEKDVIPNKENLNLFTVTATIPEVRIYEAIPLEKTEGKNVQHADAVTEPYRLFTVTATIPPVRIVEAIPLDKTESKNVQHADAVTEPYRLFTVTATIPSVRIVEPIPIARTKVENATKPVDNSTKVEPCYIETVSIIIPAPVIHHAEVLPEGRVLVELEKTLPWLRKALTEDKVYSIKIEQGVFKIGNEATTIPQDSCQNSPSKEVGVCKLLKDCPQVHSKLDSVDTYSKHLCSSYGFAAVCCPE